MNIGSSYVNIFNTKISSCTSSVSKNGSIGVLCDSNSKSKDTFEISSPNYTSCTQNTQTQGSCATSGNERLKITRSEINRNKFVIHFSDSAQLSRTVENGYLYVNCVKIELSDSVKTLLTSVDKAVQTKKRMVCESNIMKENMEAAKKQSEAMEKYFDKMNKVFEIASRIAKGGKVPPADEQLLMDVNPGLYMMSRLAAMTAKKHKKYDSLVEEEEQQKSQNDTDQNVPSYETQMCVSINGTPSVESVSAAEINR